jgi:thioredoxin-related protein
MKLKHLVILLIFFTTYSFTVWQPSFEKAKQAAREKHQLILLNFSGSDWCGPCIRMHKEIFEVDVFLKMADSTLVLFNADFPRNKKNQLEKTKKQENESLADKYNPEGKFPFTLLINADGKVIRSWDGLPAGGAQRFANQVKNICDANK